MSLGVLGFAVAVIDFLMVRSRPPEQSLPPRSGRTGGRAPGVTYPNLFRSSRFWLIGLAYLLTGFAILVPFTFLSTYAVEELAYSYEAAVRLLMVVGVGAIAGKLVLGPLSDRTGRVKVMALCAVLIAAGSLGMAWGRGAVLVIFTAVFSLGYGAAWPLYAASASDYFSKEAAGSIVGLWTVFLGVGSVLSPIMAGWVADATGTLAWSFVLAAAAAVVSLLLLLPVGRGSPGGFFRG